MEKLNKAVHRDGIAITMLLSSELIKTAVDFLYK